MGQRIVYHFAWGPMRRKACLTGEAARRLEQLIRERAAAIGVELDDVRVYPDRVYLAVAAPPVLSPHHIVCQFKAHSAHCLRHEFQEMTRIPAVWTREYIVLAGDDISPEQVLEVYEASMPPKRRPGRPRTCRETRKDSSLNA